MLRACVRLSDIRLLIDTLSDDEVGGLLANQVRDTIKQTAVNNFRVSSTIPRNHLWKALTPQMFRFGLLHQALTRAKRYKVSVTDESSVVAIAQARRLTNYCGDGDFHINPGMTTITTELYTTITMTHG